MNPRLPLPVELLKECFEIDETSHTGLRRKWRPRSHFKSNVAWGFYNASYAGKPAGGLKMAGGGIKRYLVRFENKDWQVSRIVWAIHNGADPGLGHIDHIDGNAENNTPSNLRVADSSQNLFNRKARSGNPSGYAGVNQTRNGKWSARLMARGVEFKIGVFDSLRDAILARKKAEILHYGEFAYCASRTEN